MQSEVGPVSSYRLSEPRWSTPPHPRRPPLGPCLWTGLSWTGYRRDHTRRSLPVGLLSHSKAVWDSGARQHLAPLTSSHLSTSRQRLSAAVFLIVAILVSVKCYFIMVLICISLMTKVVEHHFTWLLTICNSSLVKRLLKSFANFLIGLFIFFLSLRVIYYRYKAFSEVWFASIFSQSVAL